MIPSLTPGFFFQAPPQQTLTTGPQRHKGPLTGIPAWNRNHSGTNNTHAYIDTFSKIHGEGVLFGSRRKSPLDETFSDLPALSVPLAVVEVTPISIKALVRDANKSSVWQKVYPIDEEHNLATQLDKCYRSLRRRNAEVITVANASHQPADGWENLSTAGSLTLVDGTQRGDYLRHAMLRREYTDLDKVILDVGSNITVIGFANSSKNLTLPLGAVRHALDRPFDHEALSLLKKETQALLPTPNELPEANGKQLYIAPKAEFLNLLNRHGHHRKNKPLTSVPKEEIDYFLSNEGLEELQKHQPNRYRQMTAFRLAVLSAVMEAYGMEQVQIVPATSLRVGVMRATILEKAEAASHLSLDKAPNRDKVRQALMPNAEELSKQYEEEQPEIERLMHQLFGDLATVTVRAKSVDSIADKLANKTTQDHQAFDQAWSLDGARDIIGDGIGCRIVLKDGNEQDVRQIVDTLAWALRRGILEITEMHNYTAPAYGKGQTIRPYLESTHLATLAGAAMKACASGQVKKPSPWIHAVFGKGQPWFEIKDSGYTAVQMNVIYKDPHTKQILGTGELQIRGPEVDKLAKVEHFLYDIRRSKLLEVDRQQLPDELKHELDRVLASLPKTDQGSYTSEMQQLEQMKYLRFCYMAARAKEMEGSFKVKTPPFVKERKWLSIDELAKLLASIKQKSQALDVA